MKTLKGYMSDRFPLGGQLIIHLREMKIVEQLLKKAGAPWGSLLDCPCGYGRLTDLLKPYCDRLVSSDMSPRRMAAHKEHFRDILAKPLYARCNILQLPFQDQSFDGIVTFRLFHHLVQEETRRNVFKEAARVSRKYLIVSYYTSTLIHELSRKLHRNKEIRNKRKAFLTTQEIMAEASAAGWELVESHSVMPLVHAQTVALFRKKL